MVKTLTACHLTAILSVFFKDPSVCSERKQKEGTYLGNCSLLMVFLLSFVLHRWCFSKSSLILDERSALCEIRVVAYISKFHS